MPLLFAFIAAAALLAITPGVDTAMVLRTATVEGRKPAVLAAIGIALGCLIWGGAVSLGLGALLRAAPLAYTIIKFLGAGYLLWLGAKLLFRPRATFADSTPMVQSGRSAFWRGLLTNILNPKIGVFYITFLPQFVPVHASIASYTFMLACLQVSLSLTWFAVLIAATVPLGKILRRPKAVKILDRLTGGVFMEFGIKIATSSLR